MLEFYFGLFILALAIGSVLGWVAMSRLAKVQQQLTQLQRAVKALEAGKHKPSTNAQSRTPQHDPLWTPVAGQVADATPATITRVPGNAADRLPEQEFSIEQTRPSKVPETNLLSSSIGWVKQYWMVNLGALCIALAGIFLVRYSIERGLLDPVGRILLAVFTGLTLHAAAEVLCRRVDSHPALTALAGSASIALYSATLAALHLYDLLSPGVAFLALALIVLPTMALALRQGPSLAAIGILGAYVVPLLIFDGGSPRLWGWGLPCSALPIYIDLWDHKIQSSKLHPRKNSILRSAARADLRFPYQWSPH